MSSNTRPSSFFERYYIWRDVTGSLSRGFNMSVKLNRPVSDELLSQALRATVLAHPQLLLHFVRSGSESVEEERAEEDARANGTNYAAALVPRLAFGDVVHHTSAALDDAELTRLAGVRIACNAPTPSWYIQVSTTAKAQYLTFACNHILFDGRSVTHFFDDFVRALGDLPRAESLPLADILFDPEVDSVAIPAPSSEVVDLYNSPWWFLAKFMCARFVPKVVSLVVAAFSHGPDLDANPILNVQPMSPKSITRFHKVHLDANQLAALLARCRAAGSTMAPFLAACACHALDGSVVAAIGGTHTYQTELIVCGRRFYPGMEDKTRYGLYIAPAFDFVQQGVPMEESAGILSQNLSKLICDRSRFWLVGLLDKINIWAWAQEKFFNNDLRLTVEVSNVGLLRIEHGDWSVEDYVFSQTSSSSHMTLSVASTPNGGTNIVVASLESMHKLEVDGLNAMEMFYRIFAQTLLGE